VFETVGDAVYAAFATPAPAAAAALAGQRALDREPWGEVGALRARMGLHTGEAERQGGHYFGAPLYRCARLTAAAHGGQTVLSAATAALVQEALPAAARLRDLGEHRLKDLQRPERVFQLLHPDLRADFPPLRTLDARPHNLPVQLTPFVGREGEVAAVRERLLRPGVRLVTLTGPGGVGKTRLALQAAAEALEAFGDGVVFVPLATVAAPELVPAAVAQALGLREDRGDGGDEPAAPALRDLLRDALRPRALLLVLDNCEHLLPGAAPLVADLLTACPRLTVLTTSRAVLRLSGEHVVSVLPLTLPPADAAPPPAELLRAEAVRLFVERAQAATSDFVLTPANAPEVVALCRRLDGLPLALELAAARARLLPPRALLARLGRRLPLLTGGPADAPARQRTLRDAIGWSHDLLAPRDQTLFRRLGVFAGGCTLEAAEAVCLAADGDASPSAGPDALDGLGALVDQSLVQRWEQADGEPRFAMLETVREYALERLEQSGEAEAVRGRHTDYYLALAEAAGPALRGPEQLEWLARLEREQADLRQALRWCLDRADAGRGLRLGGALWYFWHVRARLYGGEGREWLARLLALDGGGASSPPAARAAALLGLAVLTSDSGDARTARRLAEESVGLLRGLGDARALGAALVWLGHVVQQDDPETTRRADEEGLAIARQTGDAALLARALNNLGELARRAGDLGRATALYEESLALARAQGHRWRVAALTHNLGHSALHRGGATDAAASFAESLRVARELGDQRVIAHCLASLACVAAARNHHGRAARLLGAGDALLAALETTYDPADRNAYTRAAARARAALGGEAFAAAWAAGRALPLEQAVAYALEEGPYTRR
jgi:predicted ATPase